MLVCGASSEHIKKIREVLGSAFDILTPDSIEVAHQLLGEVDGLLLLDAEPSLRAALEALATTFATSDQQVEELNDLRQRLDEQSSLFNVIFWQAPIGITISHGIGPIDGKINEQFNVNPKFCEITGYTKEELKHLGWSQVTHPEDLAREMKIFRELQEGKISSYAIEKRYIRRDGSHIWAHVVVAPLFLESEHTYSHICLIQDITERKKVASSLLESERSKEALLSHLPGMAYRCKNDHDWTMLYVSAGCEVLTGYPKESLINSQEINFNDIVVSKYRQDLHSAWREAIQENRAFEGEYEIITKSGERKWIWEMGQGIVNSEGVVEELEGLLLDITDRKRIEDELLYHSRHDLLTGLYNRLYLEQLLSEATKRRKRERGALVAINLSALHISAMTYGFLYAQEVLTTVAEQLQLLGKQTYSLCRIHEYHFVFYIEEYATKTKLIDLVQEISEVLSSSLPVGGIGWGIGIVEINKSASAEVEILLRNLMVASEQAVELWGTGSEYCFFDEEMEIRLHREEEITSELSRLASGEGNGSFYLNFQPVIDLKSRKINGFEALARLDIPALGTIPPLEFIPIAEKSKLIIPLGDSIILEALHFLKRLEHAGYGDLVVSINISAIQLLKHDFAANLLRVVKAIRANPKSICLEITESIFAANYQEINRIIRPLRKIGMKVAIDDFGTGYSSLAREWELEIDCLKIDRFFIKKLDGPERNISITGDIISMAHRLGHCVIAEGVETEGQHEYLQEHHCDKVQGFLFSRPLDENQALAFLKQWEV
jgi:PAS domain S-box-containing protein